MKRFIILVYGISCYIIGMLSFVFIISLLFGWKFTAMAVPSEHFTLQHISINIGLLLLFSVQHSFMAHKTYKTRANISPAVERSTYVLSSGILLILISFCWQPLPGKIWMLDDSSPLALLLLILESLGWLLTVISTFLISHTDLFGLRQSWMQWQRKSYTQLPFKLNFFYSLCRHPMMSGLLLAFWATPNMTSSRLLFASGMTVYILIGIYFEEKGLQQELGKPYREYCQSTPKLIPKNFNRRKNSGS
ncbi:hypothetical protein QVN42_13105 [Yersinia nurmii]|uniref:Methanethiol S-methyltransferase n=1 Tax=Yersinia nurmii TaxID=685706 RepID=A0AAW7K182_9GAMM|nr:hypothetical protein [Yersinia nurmii]MDN0088308.1 hypothetical protein [Yersinia nurmii]CNE37376.1 Putative protein-S-isoprenylcysteine methyltransferase [Yersinia nurmii]